MYFWYQSVASAARWLNVASLYVCGCTGTMVGATKNARPENAGLENDGQLRKESQGLENAGLENDGPCQLARMFFTNFFNWRYTGWLLNSNIMMCTRMLLANCTLVITLSDTYNIHAHVSNSIFIIVQQYQQ